MRHPACRSAVRASAPAAPAYVNERPSSASTERSSAAGGDCAMPSAPRSSGGFDDLTRPLRDLAAVRRPASAGRAMPATGAAVPGVCGPNSHLFHTNAAYDSSSSEGARPFSHGPGTMRRACILQSAAKHAPALWCRGGAAAGERCPAERASAAAFGSDATVSGRSAAAVGWAGLRRDGEQRRWLGLLSRGPSRCAPACSSICA